MVEYKKVMEKTIAHDGSFPVIIVGGPLDGIYTRDDIVSRFCKGMYTQDCSQVRAKGFIVQRKELDIQPKIPGYFGPMWDGCRLRYESPDVNEVLSV